MKLVKPIITALICAILIGTNAWLAAMSLTNDAYAGWSPQLRVMVNMNVGAHILMAACALGALAYVRLLWGAAAGALAKAGVALWAIAYMTRPDYTAAGWTLVAFWILVAIALFALIRWNYPPAEARELDHPEREFA